MKHQLSSDEETRELLITTNRLRHNEFDLNDSRQLHPTAATIHQNMMTNDSLESTGTKMLMPHEIGGASSAASLVGQHSIHTFSDQLHHGAFYHSGGSFNGFHNSFHTFPTLNSSSTMITNNHTTTFSNLIHQQMNNNHHAVTTASSVPPLIHQQTFYTNQSDKQAPEESVVAAALEEEDKKSPVEASEELAQPEEVPAEEPEPEIDIVISNVVCAFSVRCPLTLKDIALNGANVEYKRENGMVTMKLRNPYTTASIWSSGKITCTGATSEDQARVAARRYARVLQKLNFKVRFQNYRVVNVLGTCKMPWAIKIIPFSEKYKKEASYEPELHPGVTYNLQNPTATLKIFTTGSMTVTARSVANVQAAIEHIYPLVYEFRNPRKPKDSHKEEDEALKLMTNDSDDDEDFDDDLIEEDPLELEQPPSKKQKMVRDVSHLTKRFKGGRGGRGPKRPPGKMNDPSEDLICVSDGDFDADDPDAL